jgi:hypothetical protein
VHVSREHKLETPADHELTHESHDKICIMKTKRGTPAGVLSTRLSGFETSFHFQTRSLLLKIHAQQLKRRASFVATLSQTES